MLALIGSLAGFLTSFIPELCNFVKDKRDKIHELELIKLQIEANKALSHTRLDEVQINQDAKEFRSVYHYTSKINIGWVDAISALVRPFITYSFFFLYLSIKLLIISDYYEHISMPIWTDEDQGIFCAVIGFWFGHRALSKGR